ncbi:hypothetical protein PF008_g19640 [Phytophthora fragariae]|uniref:Uncharacterized protein n=1 Tax=Phytophthora fragariae TaxID=53985 RepID=A0A6G0R2W8_9STRA|nr:hypothetical protein PF008_g19640 [Phytophthora fragariae]
MSPQQPPPQRSDSGGASADRLNAYLYQVPAAHHFPLMHVERPSGQQLPPKAKAAPDREEAIVAQAAAQVAADQRQQQVCSIQPAVCRDNTCSGRAGRGSTVPGQVSAYTSPRHLQKAVRAASEQFAQHKAALAQDGSNSPKSAPVLPTPVVDAGSANKLNIFMKQQPSTLPAALEPRSQRKLVAFLATSNPV